MNGPNNVVLHNTGEAGLVNEKCSSLLVPIVTVASGVEVVVENGPKTLECYNMLC